MRRALGALSLVALALALALALTLAFAPALAGCDRGEAPRQPPAPTSAPSAAASLGLGLGLDDDAGDLEAPVDPPAPAGELRAEVDAFTTLDACSHAHAAVDPLVGDALESIGYDTMVRDACRVLDAAKARDVRRCEAIAASSLRARCVSTVAEITGNPDACPFPLSTRPDLGRDPVCLALAARDARLCGAALDAPSRAGCAAVAAHDAAPCKQLPLRAERQRCARDEARMAGAIPAASALASPAGRWVATLSGSEENMLEGTWDLDASRGVVLVERIDGLHVVFGAGPHAADVAWASPPEDASWIRAEVVVPVDRTRAHLESLEVSLPHHYHRRAELSSATALRVVVDEIERKRGGAFEVHVEGPLETGVHVRAALRTFVRDVVTASAMLGAPASGRGKPAPDGSP